MSRPMCLVSVFLYYDFDIITPCSRLLHHHSHRPWLTLSSTPDSKHTCSTNLPTIIPFPPTGLPTGLQPDCLNGFCSDERFLTCVSHTAHVIDIGWTSVCPSVRLSVCPPHADIVSKRLNLSSNCLHFFPEFQWEHPKRGGALNASGTT